MAARHAGTADAATATTTTRVMATANDTASLGLTPYRSDVKTPFTASASTTPIDAPVNLVIEIAFDRAPPQQLSPRVQGLSLSLAGA
jgi:hypothetical protein